jgi:uncharacterized protein YndB with AHSA1/START domain
VRPLWIVRLILYPALAGLALLLLTGGGEDGPTYLEGRTSQDRLFTMEFEDGRPTHFGTYIRHSCEVGEGWQVRWWSFDGKTARFRFADGRLVVREKLTRDYGDGWVGERSYSLEARVEDGRVTGTLRVVEDLGTYVCESGDVTFSARAASSSRALAVGLPAGAE